MRRLREEGVVLSSLLQDLWLEGDDFITQNDVWALPWRTHREDTSLHQSREAPRGLSGVLSSAAGSTDVVDYETQVSTRACLHRFCVRMTLLVPQDQGISM